MKNLLSKEIRLFSNILSYLFIAFAFMTLIPGYPILLGSFFVCLGVFQSFQGIRETNDILYTVLLPVDKADAVRAKYVFVCFIEIIAWLVMAALAVLRMTALKNGATYLTNPLMNANLVYLGFAAAVFALFNTVFLGGFFKTGYKFGKPFVLFIVCAMVLVGIAESLHHIPGLGALNDSAPNAAQWMILLVGLAIYAVGTALSCEVSKRRFERIDL